MQPPLQESSVLNSFRIGKLNAYSFIKHVFINSYKAPSIILDTVNKAKS